MPGESHRSPREIRNYLTPEHVSEAIQYRSLDRPIHG